MAQPFFANAPRNAAAPDPGDAVRILYPVMPTPEHLPLISETNPASTHSPGHVLGEAAAELGSETDTMTSAIVGAR